jgi:hypothetical protein
VNREAIISVLRSTAIVMEILRVQTKFPPCFRSQRMQDSVEEVNFTIFIINTTLITLFTFE